MENTKPIGQFKFLPASSLAGYELTWAQWWVWCLDAFSNSEVAPSQSKESYFPETLFNTRSALKTARRGIWCPANVFFSLAHRRKLPRELCSLPRAITADPHTQILHFPESLTCSSDSLKDIYKFNCNIFQGISILERVFKMLIFSFKMIPQNNIFVASFIFWFFSFFCGH